MSKKLLIFVVISLLAINIYTLISSHSSKKQAATDARKVVSESDELHAYSFNFVANIQNDQIKLEEIVVKDSLDNIFPLKNIFDNKGEQLLVCRFSELHCESCVNASIQLLRHCVDSIGTNNVLFLGTYRNNKIFNREKPMYGIDNMNVYNVVSEMNIPAEKYGYPYYFILNKDMTISNVFIPDKGTPKITNIYLKTIYERYFK